MSGAKISASGHKHCWHSLKADGVMGCCDCDATLLPGITWEHSEKSHSLSPVAVAAMHTSAFENFGRLRIEDK